MTTVDPGHIFTKNITHPNGQIVTLTPELAEAWLTYNTRNRKLSETVVRRYQADMEAGRWTFAADPIRFDIHGTLLDGQHRLTALARCTDIALPFLIIRGLPPEAQTVMDQGRKRTTADQLGLRGVRNATNVAAGARVYLLWVDRAMFRNSNMSSALVSSPRIEAWAQDNADKVERINSYMTIVKANDATPSVSIAAAYAFDDIDPDATREFFEALAHGGMPLNNPINTLDKRLQRIRREGLAITQRDYLGMFFQAWNAWREGRELSKLPRPSAGWNDRNFPTPR